MPPRLVGTWSTILLPIADDDAIDMQRLDAVVATLVAARPDGIYTNGTAAEFHAQTEPEFDAITELVAGHCRAAGIPLQIGVSHPMATGALRRLEASKKHEPVAFQTILPDFVAPNRAERVAFLKRMADVAEGTDLVLYLPPHAKSRVDVDEVRALHDAVPSLAGIKVPGGDPSWYAAARAALGDRVSVFVPGHHVASGLLQGAHGSYSNVACLSPRGAKRWADGVASDPLAALAVEHQIVDAFERFVVPFARRGFGNTALDKLLAFVGGWADVGLRLRWPYVGIPESEAAAVRDAMRDALPPIVLEESIDATVA